LGEERTPEFYEYTRPRLTAETMKAVKDIVGFVTR
jgi:hypothetical protein